MPFVAHINKTINSDPLCYLDTSQNLTSSFETQLNFAVLSVWPVFFLGHHGEKEVI